MHAERYGGGGVYLPYPQDVNELLRMLWPASIERGADGILRVAGLDVVSIAREFGTPVYVIDEDDFRARARAFREEFTTAFADVCGGAEVYYAGKAFLCTEVARWPSGPNSVSSMPTRTCRPSAIAIVFIGTTLRFSVSRASTAPSGVRRTNSSISAGCRPDAPPPIAT